MQVLKVLEIYKLLYIAKKIFFFNCPTIIFGFLFHKGLLLYYCAFGRPEKIYPSPGEVLENCF